uniref:Probable ATP-dependent RNA helicase spindle-E n=1 Tax=Glossina austeni TaxID=7395 RepID=A0A1A9UTM0_GLOAU
MPMDEINDFFDFSKDFVRRTVPRGCVSGSLLASAGQTHDRREDIRRNYEGSEYAQAIVEQERIRLDQVNLRSDSNKLPQRAPRSLAGASSCMNDVESLVSDSEFKIDEGDYRQSRRPDNGLYDRYHFDLRRDETLPIHDSKEQIIASIRENPVTVLEGDTGCGKTTQVPQYILDDAYRRREYCKIVCTQPRRIAAISISGRVCSERKWPQGSVVGYQVGLHANVTEDTRLLYCTTGVLLQKLIREKSMTHFTHIILDEVHERDQEMDFLLFVVRRLLTTNSKQVKIILMSATINSMEFSNYFKFHGRPAPIIRGDSRRLFEVREFYLCDLDKINPTKFRPDYADPGISQEMYTIALKLIVVIDNIEKQEVKLSLSADNSVPVKTSILIFLPGINEIDLMYKKLEQLNETARDTSKLNPIRLHSLISPNEQLQIFKPAPAGYRRIILSTNIAESSVTVSGVKYVIDFCLAKSLFTDPTSNFTSLQLHWASHANCCQRAGRAGRVMKGRVYRLVHRSYYETYMERFSTPEMLRCPLENVVLKAKLLDMGPPPDILALTMAPPDLSAIHNTILTLKEIGALYKNVNGYYSVQDGDLTYMGRIMASLPLDIRLTRLIILGYIYSVLDDAIVMAAGLSVRSVCKLQSISQQNDLEAYVQKLVWADSSGSDLYAILRAYRTWTSMREHNSLRNDKDENDWAQRFFINLRSIKEMHLLVQEIRARLISFNIKEQTSYQRVHWMEREKPIVLKIIIAGAFYPNYFTRSNLNDTDRERGVYHTLCGNDPCSTVYFTNFSTQQIGQLYTRSIKALFKGVLPKDIEVRFQPGSERVFVTFTKDPEFDCEDVTKRLLVPGRVKPDVYKAIRMRMSSTRLHINAMDPRLVVKYATERGYGAMVDGVWKPNDTSLQNVDSIVLPSVFEKKLRGLIAHIEHCSKFFFLPLGEFEYVREMHDTINRPEEIENGRFRSPADISKGMILVAPLNEKYRRAKVIKFSNARNNLQFQVRFIDNGCKLCVNFEDLRKIPEKYKFMPPRVFECRLAMIQPSTVKSPNGKWAEESKEILQQCANAGRVEIEVFSVVYGVANVIIKMQNGTLNDLLVQKYFARKTEENYLSKTDHDLRLRRQALVDRFLTQDNRRENREYVRSMQSNAEGDIEPPPRELCSKIIKLRGPYSPLETKIYSAIAAGTWKCVEIEKESVNSVLLDTDPQDVHEHLVVAAAVTENQSGNTIVARGTTLMPNIHGFGALVTMMFCPTMQIKRNKNLTKYVTILAGLGYDQNTLEPMYGQHDLVLNLDVELDKDDFKLVNQLRYSMDVILYTDPGPDERPNVTPTTICDLQAKLKQIIIKLFTKNRKYIETHNIDNDNVWERFEREEILETKDVFGERSIFPMLTSLRLYSEDYDRIKTLLTHCEELHNLRHFDGAMQTITCLLCNQPLENVVQVRMHLLSQLHRDREQQIEFKPPRK